MAEAWEKKANSRDFDDALFYSLVTMSFTLGFWVFLAINFINMSWRTKYFKIIDECYNMCIGDF